MKLLKLALRIQWVILKCAFRAVILCLELFCHATGCLLFHRRYWIRTGKFEDLPIATKYERFCLKCQDRTMDQSIIKPRWMWKVK